MTEMMLLAERMLRVWCNLVQALRPGVQGGKDGSFRASFEDKPLMSDIIFLRAWVAVDLPRFYNPVTNLLAPAAMEARAPKPRGRDAPQPDSDEV